MVENKQYDLPLPVSPLPPLPVRTFRRVYHIGSMDIAQKRPDSHEGRGLSISVDPDEWRLIGRGVVSGDLWAGTRLGNRFLDFRGMNQAHRQMIADWAVENGYAIKGTVWRVSWYDDEDGDISFIDYTDRGQAE
jgi:hypothetical protein